MHSVRVVLGCAIASMSVLVTSGPALGQTVGGTGGGNVIGAGTVNGGGVGVNGGVPGGTPVSAGSSGGGSGNGSGGSASSCQWTLVGHQTGGNGVDPQGNVLPGAAGGTSGETPTSPGTPVSQDAVGTWYLMTCPGQPPVSVFAPNGAGGPPPPPPPPPSPAEVVAATPFPAETIHHSPCYLGLTGLQGDMWATVSNGAVPPVTASTNIRGYTVTSSAHPVQYRWAMGNGDAVVGTASGTRDNPSASYTYQQTGEFTVTLTVSWAGTFTFSGYGTTRTQALPVVAQAPPRQLVWPVQGAVSALVAPGYVDSTTLPALPSAC
jgi:hypothetical protein